LAMNRGRSDARDRQNMACRFPHDSFLLTVARFRDFGYSFSEYSWASRLAIDQEASKVSATERRIL
jgi:hypothetical protein